MKAYREFDPHTSQVVSKLHLRVSQCNGCDGDIPVNLRACRSLEISREYATLLSGENHGFCPRTYVRYLMMKTDGEPTVLIIQGDGDFWNADKVMSSAKHCAVSIAASERDVVRLQVEAECAGITSQDVTRVIEMLAGKPLEIGLTLKGSAASCESKRSNFNPYIREYLAALKVIHRRKGLVATHVALTGCYDSERRFLKTAETLIGLAFGEGSDTVYLSFDAQDNEVRSEKHHCVRGLPWSLLELVVRCHSLGPLFFDLHRGVLQSIIHAKNYGESDKAILEAMHAYNESLNLDVIKNGALASRPWRQQWLARFGKPGMPGVPVRFAREESEGTL